MDTAEKEKQHSEEMNKEAIARIKAEEEAKASVRSEVTWFEDDDKITLRDGSVRRIPPLLLGDARRFMQRVKTCNIDAIILNFAPGNSKGEIDLYDILAMAFRNYSDIVTVNVDGSLEPNRDYLDHNIDVRMARLLIDSMLDLNATKK